MKLIIENIRSFSGPHKFDVKPLTFLVGENSSGKSTFLAALAAVSDSASFPAATIFNKPPYDLGTYDTIATYKGGRGGRAKSFSLGYEVGIDASQVVKVVATYCSDAGETRINKLELSEGNVKATIFWSADTQLTEVTGLEGMDLGTSLKGQFQIPVTATLSLVSTLIPSSIIRTTQTKVLMQRTAEKQSTLLEQLFSVSQTWVHSAPLAASIAPIRSEPKRTYDRLSDEYDPSGDHIPYILARMLHEKNSKKNQALHDALIEFGLDSGLFKKVSVKRLGDKTGDPFQMQITVGGPPVNLSDVGYGVSQSLPIVVESILHADGSRILLQQPEVHLHPRAQAALGTFFAKLAASDNRQFVIETHSDYLIDRVRQEVAAGHLPAESVSILFFHRPHIETSVSSLTLDKQGNIQDAPRNYREFFLEEELRTLTRAD